ncbi:MAG: hypothetical protein KTR25_20615 [Myxococcales bacterium]|nr:hypothetical protein [Myxococcales bacterium]
MARHILLLLGLIGAMGGGDSFAAAPPRATRALRGSASDGARRLLVQAVADLEAGRREQAAAQLAELVTLTRTRGSLAVEVRYNFAKALYRLGYFHAALAEFEAVLEQGSASKFYRASLEWCLFIGRKLSDDTLVNKVLVKYKEDQFPAQYRDEFLFKLARHHYTQAFFAASMQRAKFQAPPSALEDDDGISFEEDLFGDREDKWLRRQSQRQRASRETPSKARRPGRNDGGEELSFGEDLFGEEVSSSGQRPSGGRGRNKQPYVLAQRLLDRVSVASSFYPRAQFLKGLLLVQRKQENEALKAFKTVIEVTGQAENEAPETEDRSREQLRELAFFQLARLHFGARQPSFSIFYYRRVDQDSLQWLDALYEASWAEYRLGTYERALGNLLTVHAPFFEDVYFPESLILKAVIYYENCRYRDAEQIIEAFMTKYEPLLVRLNEVFEKKKSLGDWYQYFSMARVDREPASGSDDSLNQMIQRIMLSDPEVRRLSGAELELTDELRNLRRLAREPMFTTKVYMARVIERLEQLHRLLSDSAGGAVARKLRTERISIKTLIAQALRIQVETAKAEEGRLEASLNQRNQRPRRIKKAPMNWGDDEKLVWPFKGEYWRDELGTYELSLVRTCR